MTRIAGTSTERPNEDTGKRYEILPKRLGGRFCMSVKDLPRTARIYRAILRDTKIKLGSLVAPTGKRT